jgi:hypothetical protein
MDIALTQGKHARIDDNDFDLIRDHKWYALKDRNTWYAMSWLAMPDGSKKLTSMHRVIMAAAADELVDHKDGDGLNNVRGNLRRCTRGQNQWNSKVRSHSKTGIKNVSFEGGKWRVTVKAHGVRHRALFAKQEDAVAWASAKRVELHGEFARDG